MLSTSECGCQPAIIHSLFLALRFSKTLAAHKRRTVFFVHRQGNATCHVIRDPPEVWSKTPKHVPEKIHVTFSSDYQNTKYGVFKITLIRTFSVPDFYRQQTRRACLFGRARDFVGAVCTAAIEPVSARKARLEHVRPPLYTAQSGRQRFAQFWGHLYVSNPSGYSVMHLCPIDVRVYARERHVFERYKIGSVP